MKNNTHCPSGHPYDESNTYKKCGRRYCRACRTQRSKEQWERVKAERVRLKKGETFFDEVFAGGE